MLTIITKEMHKNCINTINTIISLQLGGRSTYAIITKEVPVYNVCNTMILIITLEYNTNNNNNNNKTISYY